MATWGNVRNGSDKKVVNNMAKNNLLIESMKRVQREIDNTVPNVYAAIALALHRKHGWGYKRINDLFVESQKIWDEANDKYTEMPIMCLDEIGIDVRGAKNGSIR